MTLEEERLNWQHDSARINDFVTSMVEHLRDKAEAETIAYMIVDMAFRPYLQWLHSAQVSRQDPQLVRNSSLHLINIIILELATRVRATDDEGNPLTKIQWVNDFMGDLVDELSDDLDTLTERAAGNC